MRSRSIAMSLAAGILMAAFARAEAPGYRWQLPTGFPEPAVPADNPMNEAKVALGAMLFADTRLSVTGRYSCASCHSSARAFTDGLALSRGATGEALPLNAPTLFNVAYNSSLGWRDANLRTLEQQMRGPLFNQHPVELGLDAGAESLLKRLADDMGMSARFEAAFPGDGAPVTLANLIRAIAAYERTLLSGDSPFDRYVYGGDHRALSDRQKVGMELFFGRAGCAGCHAGINFNGEWVDRDHPVAQPSFADTGSGVAVRVPTLRNIAATSPYMHDGRFVALDAVIMNYEDLAASPAADPRLRRAPLTTGERQALHAFLLSLSGAP
jgi:cytochrome c peroxidase